MMTAQSLFRTGVHAEVPPLKKMGVGASPVPGLHRCARSTTQKYERFWEADSFIVAVCKGQNFSLEHEEDGGKGLVPFRRTYLSDLSSCPQTLSRNCKAGGLPRACSYNGDK
jgi:hypothetical protein